jgi:hypothetical protein
MVNVFPFSHLTFILEYQHRQLLNTVNFHQVDSLSHITQTFLFQAYNLTNLQYR